MQFIDAEAEEGEEARGPCGEQAVACRRRDEQRPARDAGERDSSHEVVDLCGADGGDSVASCDAASAAASSSACSGRGGKFRVCARSFALTYPQCAVQRADFDPVFKLKFGPAEFASAREDHADGSKHLHVFVAFKKRVDVRRARHFDVAIGGRTYHANTQRVKSRAAWLQYISKGDDHGVGDLRRDVGFDPLSAELGKRKSLHADFVWSEQYRVRAAMRAVSYPIELVCEGKSYAMLQPDPRVKKRNWWIVAPPNAGKTRWLNRTFAGQRIWAPRTGPYPFEGYGDEDIVVYDDRTGVSFAEFASVLNTWDIIMPVAGQVRYNVQNWKLGHTRSVIVLSNKTIEQSMPEEDHQRMKKRFIQIVNPVLIPPEELSSDDEAEGVIPAPAVNCSEFAT